MNLFREWKRDVPASIVVFFVAVPLCLGIALASGAPLISGLVAGVVGGLVVGTVSRSPLGVSGPAAGLAVIVLGAIAELGSFETFLLAVVLAGALQLLLGLLRAGVLAYFFPSSVIKGMLAGIGVLIILKQIPHALGHDSDPVGDLAFVQPDGETTLSSFEAMIGDLTPACMLVSVVCLAILILWDKVLSKKGGFFTLVQGPLVAVAFGIVYQLVALRVAPSWAVDPSHMVTVPVAGSLAELSGMLSRPDLAQLSNPAVWVVAVTIAVVASLETLLCVEATDKLDPRKRTTPTNRELVAQGLGNMVSGALGGLPVTQVIVRSSANIQSGGRTKLATILHGAMLLAAIVLLPELLNMVLLPALASILIVVGFKLARPSLFQTMWKHGPAQFLPFVITIVAIVFTDLLTGIGLGMVAALFAILRGHYINSHFLHIEETGANDGGRRVTMELAEEVTFLNKGAIVRELSSIPDGTHVVIDATGSVFIDHDVLEAIDEFETYAQRRDITLERVGDFTADVETRRAKRRRPAPPRDVATGAAV